ncbi:Rgp1-domain-containing protein [Pseudomassariella vexata]|uniref:Rgp1-domain-containing protein n=1 Tax=Pseudomassariella vexata TaxID=1141098 RepID=A0A1Y2DA22_9PEZI|nr:Rgp1-domain-containing protein [Pseudomassariella vexata]ORY56118.1 Rgp1-domain-containing protein [Pseudomassariella vexata]
MTPDGPSNIRVFIHWSDQTVFAGEDIQCRITFKNVARPPNQSYERSRQPSPLLGTPRHKSVANNSLTPPVVGRGRGHRSTLSLNVPSSSSRVKSGTTQWIQPRDQPPSRPGHAHKRSLSIVSIGSAATVEDAGRGHAQRPTHGHGRSSSLQINSRGSLSNGPHSAVLPQRPYGGSSQNSPLFNNHSFPPSRHAFGRPSGASTVPNTPRGATHSPKTGGAQIPDFKFPMVFSALSGAGDSTPGAQGEDYVTTSTSATGGTVNLPVRSRDSIPIIAEHAALPAARILSTTSMTGGTPRSSGEFYSLSNNSSETLASEYVTQPLRNGGRPPHNRRSSGLSGLGHLKAPEALMMGYAQVQGFFTLDGSLINLGPFEQVKRKAVLGGQGGGVIGLESSKRDSGLLKTFGWGSWGNSIGELLGGGEMSSIKEMRGVASTKSIPLLSTPQSILFVDLQLAPGESRTYEYSFKLPKGLPPTHRGKAMKISYSLVIGTQRPGGSKEQQVRSVEIPFRVLGSVNSHGEILGHDLMSPYIILRDLAHVQLANNSDVPKMGKPAQPNSTLNGFIGYVEELLAQPHNGHGLLSPTAVGPSSRRPSMFEDASTAKEAIDLAILRSNMSSSETGQSSNRFEIARNGQRVGVIMLARPAYRLGEAVSMVIDFTDAEIPCYAVHSALETAERVEPTLALRSEASVHRVTRKVYGSSSEATLFARRVVFSPTIPITATPEFVTSGLSLEWKIRIEFVVPSSTAAEDEESEKQANGPHPLLEEISRDERGGLVLVGAETLECESFEVAVPLRVYGAVCNGLERLERDEAEEGLVV